MPYVTAEDGVRIHYELEGPEGGTPLVLLHGITWNLRFWHEAGYVERLSDRFRLLLLDARGHGESDKPTHAEGYDWRARTLDVVSAMRDAGIERAHLWGYSMGGANAQSAAVYAPQVFRSLIIGGASPYGRHWAAIVAAVPFANLWQSQAHLRGADREAWEASWTNLGKFGGGVQALKTTRLPYLLYAGDGDPGASRGNERFAESYGARRFCLEGKTHPAAFLDAADEVVPRVSAFIDEVEAAAR